MIWLIAMVKQLIPIYIDSTQWINDYSLTVNRTTEYFINISDPNYLFLSHSNTEACINIKIQNSFFNITKNSNISGVSFGSSKGSIIVNSERWSQANFSLIRIPEMCRNIKVSTFGYFNLSNRHHLPKKIEKSNFTHPRECYVLSPGSFVSRNVMYKSQISRASYLDPYNYYENQLEFNVTEEYQSSCIVSTFGSNFSFDVHQVPLETPHQREVEFSFNDTFLSYIIYFTDKPPKTRTYSMTHSPTHKVPTNVSPSDVIEYPKSIEFIQAITIALFLLSGIFVIAIIGIILYVHYYKKKKINENIMNEMLMESTETNTAEINSIA